MRAMLMSRCCHPRKIEKGKNPIVTDGGAMQRRTGETFVKWAKRVNLEIHEENYKAITCPTNPEDVNQFICCGRDNKAYFADQQYDNEIFINAERWRMTLTQFLVRSGRYVGNKITKQYVDEFHFTEEVRAKTA